MQGSGFPLKQLALWETPGIPWKLATSLRREAHPLTLGPLAGLYLLKVPLLLPPPYRELSLAHRISWTHSNCIQTTAEMLAPYTNQHPLKLPVFVASIPFSLFSPSPSSSSLLWFILPLQAHEDSWPGSPVVSMWLTPIMSLAVS